MLRIIVVLALFDVVPLDQSVQEIAASGRCVSLAETPDARVSFAPRIAPGPPLVLSFRFYEGKTHHRFGNADLLMDDAGH